MDSILYILTALLFFMGLIGILTALKTLGIIKKLTASSYITVSGIIDEIVEITRGKNKVFLHPVLTFNYNETEYHVQTSLSIPSLKKDFPDGISPYKTGDEVNVRIYDSDIRTAAIDEDFLLDYKKKSANTLLTMGIISIILSVAFIIILSL